MKEQDIGAIELSSHALDMIRERGVPEEWVWWAIRLPDEIKGGIDQNEHYIKAIPEHGGRFLRVVVNPHVWPKRVVTVFFDRRLRRLP